VPGRWLHGTSKVTEDTRATKQIFQIAYTEELRRERAGLLRQLGYEVISAIGNDAAKTLLSTIENVDLTLFILGRVPHTFAFFVSSPMTSFTKRPGTSFTLSAQTSRARGMLSRFA